MTKNGSLSVDVHLSPGEMRAALIDDVRSGLTAEQKQLSPVWFYDERGSALFDEITRLPEYYLTRAERRLLVSHAPAIAQRAASDTLVELGAGTCDKSRILLDAMRDAGTLRRYAPLDVSEPTLREAASSLSHEYPGLSIHAVVGDFLCHVECVPDGGRRMIAFLGSTIGNMDPAQRRKFLSDLNGMLAADDSLLLGADLVKEPQRLVSAYDDAAGVTAAFNRNVLSVLNHELGATFEPDRFEHVARWDEEESRIEMRLRSTRPQVVDVADLSMAVGFAHGEEMRTEISSKFTTSGLEAELEESGFATTATWVDPEGFALTLASRGG